MAALTSGDWTIAEVSYPNNRVISNGQITSLYTMTLATVGTYGSGGVPIPRNHKTWGFPREFKRIRILEPVSADGNVYKYSATGYVIRVYQNPASASDAGTAQGALAEFATTATLGTSNGCVLYVEALGS